MRKLGRVDLEQFHSPNMRNLAISHLLGEHLGFGDFTGLGNDRLLMYGQLCVRLPASIELLGLQVRVNLGYDIARDQVVLDTMDK